MAPTHSFPAALKTIRKARDLSQEAFSDVSSRTYLSSLERGLKSPTLSKIVEVCGVLDVHPLTLLALAYAKNDQQLDALLATVRKELDVILKADAAS